MKKDFNTNVEMNDCSNIVDLMDIYLSEWMHRDELFWMQTYKYFYASLIVMLLPKIASFLTITLPTINAIVFPIIGIIMAMFFLYITLAYAKRLEASSKTYQKLIEMLDPALQRKSIRTLKFGKFYDIQISTMVAIIMFFALIAIGLTMIFI